MFLPRPGRPGLWQDNACLAIPAGGNPPRGESFLHHALGDEERTGKGCPVAWVDARRNPAAGTLGHRDAASAGQADDSFSFIGGGAKPGYGTAAQGNGENASGPRRVRFVI